MKVDSYSFYFEFDRNVFKILLAMKKLLKGRHSLFRVAGLYFTFFTMIQGLIWTLLTFIGFICSLSSCGKNGESGSFGYCFYLFYVRKDYPTFNNFMRPELFKMIITLETILCFSLFAASIWAFHEFRKWSNRDHIRKSASIWTHLIIFISCIDTLICSFFVIDVIVINKTFKLNCHKMNQAGSFKSNFPENIHFKETLFNLPNTIKYNKSEKNGTNNVVNNEIFNISTEITLFETSSYFENKIIYNVTFDQFGKPYKYYNNISTDFLDYENLYDFLKEREMNIAPLTKQRHLKKRFNIGNDEFLDRDIKGSKFVDYIRKLSHIKQKSNITYLEMVDFDLTDYLRQIATAKPNTKTSQKSFIFGKLISNPNRYSDKVMTTKTQISKKTTKSQRKENKLINKFKFLLTTKSTTAKYQASKSKHRITHIANKKKKKEKTKKEKVSSNISHEGRSTIFFAKFQATKQPIKLNKDILKMAHENLERDNAAIEFYKIDQETKQEFMRHVCDNCKKWSISPGLVCMFLSFKMGIAWYLNIVTALSIIYLGKVTELTPALLFSPKFG